MKILFTLILGSSLFSNYISSWAHLHNFPFGAIVRDSLIVLFIFFSILQKNFFQFKRNNVYIFSVYILLLLITLGSFFNSNSILLSLMGARPYILYTLLFFILYKTNFVVENRKYIESNLLLFFILASGIGLIDFFSFGQFSKLLGYNPTNIYDNFMTIDSFQDKIRLTGGFAGALDFGYFLLISIIYSLHRILTKNQSFIKLNLISLLFSSLAVVLTLSRAAIFAMITTYLLFIIYKLKNKVTLNFLIILFLSFIGIASILYVNYDFLELILSRFLQTDQSSLESTNTRIRMAMDSINYLTDNPFGIGLGTQGTGFLISGTNQRINTDNYYFYLALENGILGLLVNCIFFTLIVLGYVNFLRMKFIYLSLIYTFIISSLVSTSFFTAIVLIYYMTVFLVVRTEYIIYRKE